MSAVVTPISVRCLKAHTSDCLHQAVGLGQQMLQLAVIDGSTLFPMLV